MKSEIPSSMFDFYFIFKRGSTDSIPPMNTWSHNMTAPHVWQTNCCLATPSHHLLQSMWSLFDRIHLLRNWSAVSPSVFTHAQQRAANIPVHASFAAFLAFFWGDNLWRSIKPDRKTACLRLSGVSCLCTPVNRRDLNAQLQRLVDVIPVDEGWSQCLRLEMEARDGGNMVLWPV